jgi:glycyl-tRNA synthetase
MSSHSDKTLDTIVAFCKRRGFVYQSGEIYGGLTGLYDFGPLGVLVKENLIAAWKHSLITTEPEIVFIDGAILGSSALWEASGHALHFNDPMVDCLSCKKRYRTDEISLSRGCPACGTRSWSKPRQFNMMFQTSVGAAHDQTAIAYLRPETAQTIFVNFKNILSTNRLKIPFGIGQVGKAFRNEVTPKQFLFRVREFHQMELEWFCKEDTAHDYFETWTTARYNFYPSIGINKARLRLHAHEPHELAHYAQRCNDIEYQFPFGWRELEGIAHRGTYDLTQHTLHSGKDLSVYDDEKKESYTPTVIECSVGIDRLFLMLIFDAYDYDTIDGQTRVVLRLIPKIAPIKAAILPLTKTFSTPARAIYNQLKLSGLSVQFDETGSVGKRYRRQDEIGTPVCITYDFESENDQCVTVRDRDTTNQKRISIAELDSYLKAMLQCNTYHQNME